MFLYQCVIVIVVGRGEIHIDVKQEAQIQCLIYPKHGVVDIKVISEGQLVGCQHTSSHKKQGDEEVPTNLDSVLWVINKLLSILAIHVLVNHIIEIVDVEGI